MPITRTHKTVPTAGDYANLAHIQDSLNTVNALLDAVTDRTDGKMTSTSATVGDGSGSGSAGDRSWVLQVTDTVKKLLKWKNSTSRMRLEDEAGTLIPFEVADPTVSTQAATKGYVDTVTTPASQAEAEAGSNNTAVMTPLRTKQAIQALESVKYLSTVTVSGAASLTLTSVAGTTEMLSGMFFATPANDGVNHNVTVTEDNSTWKTGASDYAWRAECRDMTTTASSRATGDDAHTAIQLNGTSTIGNNTNEFISYAFNVLEMPNATHHKVFVAKGVYVDTATTRVGLETQGVYRGTQNPITGLQFAMSAGNLTARLLTWMWRAF